MDVFSERLLSHGANWHEDRSILQTDRMQSNALCVVQIDVSKNHVRSVKKNFYKPPVELDVSDNRLKSLPAPKTKKKNFIHAINASHNVIGKLPTNINNLVCMTRLDLSNNNLQEVC